MTVQERLDQLVAKGCIISLSGPNGLRFHPAMARVVEGELRWVNAFPENQHDAHYQPFGRIGIAADGIVVLDGDGEMIAYIAPFAEWEGYEEMPGMKEDHDRWTANQRDPAAKERFEAFALRQIDPPGDLQ